MSMRSARPMAGGGYGDGARFVDRTYVGNPGVADRVQNNVCAACVGILLFLVAFPVLIWNETSTVEVVTMLDDARNSYLIIADPARPQPQNDRKLVYLHAPLKTKLLDDKTLGVAAKTVKLTRTVEMFQWRERVETETKKDERGDTYEEKRTYYDKEWSSTHHNSNSFRDSVNYRNPTRWPIESDSFSVRPIVAGAFTLGPGVEDHIGANDVLHVNSDDLQNCRAPRGAGNECIPQGDYIYFTNGREEIGDVRVQYHYHRDPDVSILAAQRGTMLEPWRSPQGRQLALVEDGYSSPDDLIDNALSSNSMFTWALRGVGFLLMFIGLSMAVSPILNLVSVIPIFGGLLSGLLSIGTSIAIGLLSLCLTVITIAIGWFWARPLVSVALLAAGLVPLVVAHLNASKKQKE